MDSAEICLQFAFLASYPLQSKTHSSRQLGTRGIVRILTPRSLLETPPQDVSEEKRTLLSCRRLRAIKSGLFGEVRPVVDVHTIHTLSMKLILSLLLTFSAIASALPDSHFRQTHHHALPLTHRDASRLDKIQQMYAFEGFVYALDVSLCESISVSAD